MASKQAGIEIRLLDRQDVLRLPPQANCEALTRLAARKAIGAKPATLELFGLRAGNVWLCPSSPMSVLDELLSSQQKSNKKSSTTSLELRIRFKTPWPNRLYEADPSAFFYYYCQLRHDFDTNVIVKSVPAYVIKGAAEGGKWWYPIIPGSESADPELVKAKKAKVHLLACVIKMVALNMTIDIKERGKDKKEVLKQLPVYLPKYLWANTSEKLIGPTKLKYSADNLVTRYLELNFSILQLKSEFTMVCEACFPYHFEEIFDRAEVHVLGDEPRVAKLKVVPPFKAQAQQKSVLADEVEPYLSAVYHKDEEVKICSIEEICSISTSVRGQGEDKDSPIKVGNQITMELSRKNGIPVFIEVQGELAALSLLTALSGYYRLSEKWIFNLCSEAVQFPSLQRLLASKVHGPVDSVFVRNKIVDKSSTSAAGTYLIRSSPESHFLYNLHYTTEAGQQRVLRILENEMTGTFSLAGSDKAQSGAGDGPFDTIGDLVKAIKDEFGLKNCLHPSEFDRVSSLLLCRSSSALEADVVGGHGNRNNSGLTAFKSFIPLTSLKKYKNVLRKGKFTTVWKGIWMKGNHVEEVVAIKQMKKTDSHLEPFMHMCYNAMLWDDPTLVKIHGATLSTPGNPMALIMEFLPMGQVDHYLRRMGKDRVSEEDLLEAANGLARALWYLEEKGIVHGSIRLQNVFVAKHEEGGSGFKVKLGDPGLPDYSHPDDVHWLSLELLLDTCPTPSKCTKEGDVWAFATTLWQLFSYGQVPDVDPIMAKQQYIFGHRLARPLALQGRLQKIYELMKDCWLPTPWERTKPQAIMRELHQLMYRVVNSKKRHDYVTIDDSSAASMASNYVSRPPSSARTTTNGLGNLSPSNSMRTMQTTLDSTGTVIYNGTSSMINSSSEGGNGGSGSPIGGPPSLPPPNSASRSQQQQQQQQEQQPQPPEAVDNNVLEDGGAAAPLDDDNLQEFGTMPVTSNTLVPTFNWMMEKFLQQTHIGGCLSGMANLMSSSGGGATYSPTSSWTGSQHGLLMNGNGGGHNNFSGFSSSGGGQSSWFGGINGLGGPGGGRGGFYDSRAGSSLDGSLVNSYRSQFTMQTSLSSLDTRYSMYEIYDIEGSRVEINRQPLGEGNFGVVYKGVYSKSDEEWEQVAVKMLKDPTDASNEAEYQRELDIMRSLNHENIVRIKGVLRKNQTEDMEGIQGMIVMELVEGGSLDNYLQTNKDSVTLQQLFNFTFNIIDGMEYVGRKGIIHRDLAARNILVANDDLVKISDFGLARQPSDKNYYLMTSHSRIPVKWMAIESLMRSVYHIPSDVWSFGVVLWEMFSFGESPYLDGCEDYFKAERSEQMQAKDMANWIRKLEEGARFPKLDNCPDLLYQSVMLKCWDIDPDARPSFKELKTTLNYVEKTVT